ncbi:MAG: aminotransferase class V-fold PLP-dependent enzyme [Candidatus Omnitrophica bacterium]|nr:aminotransferase class V-fold PLP-dependent enzyme [Candidatus Omnitrophota bacterium]MCB9747813.1 aminotransferase class V-fold PLP-dependent enzyme [Candidatus Omnitrophota bacterium]
MSEFRRDFMDFEDKIWLNAASEGPLPLKAVEALKESIVWKSRPYLLDLPKFALVPRELKKSIGRLFNVEAKDVILANSASYGLHILANGMQWQAGDEILVMQNDFPTDILPWLALEKKGVKVRQLAANDKVLTPDEFLTNITERTRLFCISQVHTFTGIILEIEKMARIAKDKNIIFVLNVAQSAGGMPVDLSNIPVDAVVGAGYKWICGPYGTGFAWIHPQLREQLDYNHAYWPVVLNNEDLKSEGPIVYTEDHSARQFDIFGTANFFNFVPLTTSINYLLDIGIERIWRHNQQLVDRFITGLDRGQYQLVSPEQGAARSNLVVFSHKDPQQNSSLFKRLSDKGVFTAFWKNNIRVSPHLYNSSKDIDCILSLLEKN